MLNRTAVVVLGILFFCGSIVSAPRLPKFSSYPDLITSKYGKLTSAWVQEAIGVYEGHAFLKEVGAEISCVLFLALELWMSALTLPHFSITPDSQVACVSN